MEKQKYEIMRINSDLDKTHGALLGLAIGDALGTTLEFKPRGSFTPITDIVGGGPFDLNAGEWTDDTSMALCLAESLLDKKSMDLGDQLKRYTKWWLHGENSVTGCCFDIGNTVRNALENYGCHGEIYSGSKDPNSAGNGSIMRLAPVALYYRDSDIKETLQHCEESSKSTHQADECLIACRLLGYLIVKAFKTQDKKSLLDINENTWALIDPMNLAPKLKGVAFGSYITTPASFIKGSGYVVESLEAALWAFTNTSTFEKGALRAVNLGDDADTTGAVYGQLAGTFYGKGQIPQSWLQKLSWREKIEQIADQLYQK